MANIDKLVSYAELKLGQIGLDYREHHGEAESHEIEPSSYEVSGTNIIVHYHSDQYTIDLNKAGLKDAVTESDTQEVVDRLNEFFDHA
ncbi:DUF1797 domain-containing protein [Macrococcoides canis]|uniref:Uncharacterized protein n=1 Tax=Macrococcoides canis TaxID=1855823 RepID=A0A1W7ADD3_9STAP|nr:hypothetical protein [Macrococcus canis]ARQ07571.1 hypothetical protein MCCS_19460 [Macrococcus canis]MCO4097365.1 hypothetical protein [Macrococcus canis]QCT75304.1 hypothetical protein EST43_08515 [Macrococcus canis]QIH78935.1 hypothetical protein GTN30_09615 [Macrococcus canis]QNR08468.1 hypothetical protein GL258_09390 [Macrococcus canis]